MEPDRPPGPIIDRSGFSTPAPGGPMLNPGGLSMPAPKDESTAGKRADGSASALREEGDDRPKRTAGPGPAAGVAGPEPGEAAMPPGAMFDRTGLPIPLPRQRMLKSGGPSRIQRVHRRLLPRSPRQPASPAAAIRCDRSSGWQILHPLRLRPFRALRFLPPYMGHSCYLSRNYRKKYYDVPEDSFGTGAAHVGRSAASIDSAAVPD